MPKFRPLPPLERLNELLEFVEIPEDKYGEWSGLVWRVNRGGKARAGSVAGTPKPHSKNPDRIDWKVGVDGVQYVASRVIYYMTHREDPGDAEVDHKDRNPLNNNARNLRLDVNGDIQKVNSPIRRNNTSGVMGVNWHKDRRKWMARVRVEDKHKYLGLFTCKIEAARVVNQKWIELSWIEKGRKLNDLSQISCDCSKCSARNDRPA
jgi:hypothetical protein